MYNSFNQPIVIFLLFSCVVQSCGPNIQLHDITKAKQPTAKFSQNPPLSLVSTGALAVYSFTIGSGEEVIFFEEEGIWKAKALQDSTTFPIVCEQGKDISLMLQSCCQEPPNLPNKLIHKLQLCEESFIFLGSLEFQVAAMETEGQERILSLHEAARKGNLSLVEKFLQNGHDPNKVDHFGSTPLCYAAGQGNLALVRALLASGSDPNIANKDGNTPLHRAAMMTKDTIAVEQGLEVIKLLLAKGADPNKVNLQGSTPLNFAVRMNGYLELKVAQLFLASGAKFNINDQEGDTLLHYVAYYNNLEVITLILSDADPNKANSEGDTALHKAAENGHLDSIVLLMQAGADVNAHNNDGDTALHKAAKNGHLDTIALLVQAGANINAQNNDGDTALHIIATQNDPQVWLEAQQALTKVNAALLDSLQTCIIAYCPELCNKDSKGILLANIIQYTQQIDWSLKNNQGKSIQDLLEEAIQ